MEVWHLLHDTTIQILLSIRVQPERALRKIEVGRRFIVSIWSTLNSSSQVCPCYLRSGTCWMSHWLYGMEEMQTKARFCCSVCCCLYSSAKVSLWNQYCCAACAAASRFLCSLSCLTWTVRVLHHTEVLSQRLRWNKRSGSHLCYLLGWFKWNHTGVNVVWQSMGSGLGSRVCRGPLDSELLPAGQHCWSDTACLVVEFGRYGRWAFAWLFLQVKREWKLFLSQVSSVFFPSHASGGCVGELD